MASTARTTKRPPMFTHYVDVDVDIDPEDLEAAGWQYVGKVGEPEGPAEQTVLDVVRAWHDDTHEGPWRWCHEQPCDTLRGRAANGRD